MTEREYKCKVCGATFVSETALETHNRTAHSQYQCEACGKIFRSEHELDTHNRIAHPEDIPVP